MGILEKFESPDVLHKATGLGATAIRGQGRKMVEAGSDCSMKLSRATTSPLAMISRSPMPRCSTWRAPQTDMKLPASVSSHFLGLKERPLVRKLYGKRRY